MGTFVERWDSYDFWTYFMSKLFSFWSVAGGKRTQRRTMPPQEGCGILPQGFQIEGTWPWPLGWTLHFSEQDQGCPAHCDTPNNPACERASLHSKSPTGTLEKHSSPMWVAPPAFPSRWFKSIYSTTAGHEACRDMGEKNPTPSFKVLPTGKAVEPGESFTKRWQLSLALRDEKKVLDGGEVRSRQGRWACIPARGRTGTQADRGHTRSSCPRAGGCRRSPSPWQEVGGGLFSFAVHYFPSSSP